MAKQITKNDLKKQNKLLIVLASILTILVVAITTVVVLIPKLTINKELNVPDVTGYTIDDAIKQKSAKTIIMIFSFFISISPTFIIKF